MSDSNTAVLGTSRSGIGAHGGSDSSTGVLGTSESGFGVHGLSDRGPGGVFESKNNAQIRLLPREMASPEGRVAGAGGELLATTAVRRVQALVLHSGRRCCLSRVGPRCRKPTVSRRAGVGARDGDRGQAHPDAAQHGVRDRPQRRR